MEEQDYFWIKRFQHAAIFKILSKCSKTTKHNGQGELCCTWIVGLSTICVKSRVSTSNLIQVLLLQGIYFCSMSPSSNFVLLLNTRVPQSTRDPDLCHMNCASVFKNVVRTPPLLFILFRLTFLCIHILLLRYKISGADYNGLMRMIMMIVVDKWIK